MTHQSGSDNLASSKVSLIKSTSSFILALILNLKTYNLNFKIHYKIDYLNNNNFTVIKTFYEYFSEQSLLLFK